MADIGQYLTVQDVADRLGVSVFTIRRYIRAGKLRAVRLEAAYRISREDIGEFLKSREIRGPTIAASRERAAPGATPPAAPPGGAAASAASGTAAQPSNASASARS